MDKKTKKLKNIIRKILTESTSLATFPDAPPRAGHLPGGYPRVLGDRGGMPEPWFVKLGYDQVDYPVADHMYADGDEPEVSQVTRVNPERNSTHISDKMSDEARQELKKQEKKLEEERQLRNLIRKELRNVLNNR